MNQKQLTKLGELPSGELIQRLTRLTLEQRRNLREQCRACPDLPASWGIRFALIQAELADRGYCEYPL